MESINTNKKEAYKYLLKYLNKDDFYSYKYIMKNYYEIGEEDDDESLFINSVDIFELPDQFFPNKYSLYHYYSTEIESAHFYYLIDPSIDNFIEIDEETEMYINNNGIYGHQINDTEQIIEYIENNYSDFKILINFTYHDYLKIVKDVKKVMSNLNISEKKILNYNKFIYLKK
jgi:hypothetical protein